MLWPITSSDLWIKEQTLRTSHKVCLPSHTLNILRTIPHRIQTIFQPLTILVVRLMGGPGTGSSRLWGTGWFFNCGTWGQGWNFSRGLRWFSHEVAHVVAEVFSANHVVLVEPWKILFIISDKIYSSIFLGGEVLTLILTLHGVLDRINLLLFAMKNQY